MDIAETLRSYDGKRVAPFRTYNGLGVPAGGNPDLREEVEALFDAAAARETAGVRARIRHVRAAWG